MGTTGYLDRGSIINSSPESADIVLLCAGYDRTASFRRGAVDGPTAVISCLNEQIEFYERFTQTTPAHSCAIACRQLETLNELSPPDMVARIEGEYGRYLDRGAFVLLIGGEHSVTNGALRALRSRHRPEEVTVLQIDAHCDLRNDDSDYAAAPHGIYAHCTIMRRALDLGYRGVQVGVRAYSRDEIDIAREMGVAVFEWRGEALPRPGEIIDAVTTERVYLTIDVDGFDPSCMPATGTPVQGGVQWYYGIDLIRELFKYRQVVGADIVEVAPRPYDNLTEYGAAQLCYTIIALREYYTHAHSCFDRRTQTA